MSYQQPYQPDPYNPPPAGYGPPADYGAPVDYGTPGYPPAPGYGPPPYPYAPTPQNNTMALVSMICSLAGIFTGVTAVVGIILGHIALNQIKNTGEEGRGMAVAGLVIGYILVVVAILVFIFYLVIFVWVVSQDTSTY